jgi:hypothetical protein
MVLPIILSLLASGAAGAGTLGAMSPLLAGAIGSGLGSAIQTGDIGEGIKTGLLSGLTGGIAGSLTGGAAGSAPGILGQGAAPAATATGMTQAVGANPLAGMTGAQMLPGAAAGAAPAATGIQGMLQNIPSGMTAMPTMATDMTLREMLRQGANQGALSGAGMGAAAGAAMRNRQPGFEEPKDKKYTARYDPRERSQYAPPVGYNPGVDPEFRYFSPKMAGGGMVQFSPTGQAPIAMQGGGLADIAAATAPQAAPPMNEKAIVEGTIAAVQGKIPEEQAAPILAAFVQTYGEEALRKLVDDVQSGRAPQGGEGPVRGPGDGMDDMIPARMDDGSSDVLLSDGEFVIPADVVSGLGNGSTEAGAAELDRMMGRVREARTGKTEQPAAVAAGGMVPA